jgi:pilus assembly protein FimV
MKKTRKISGLLMALLFAWGSANAAGLGKLSVQSALGQPLRAEIELLSVSKEELADITARLASADAFRQARIDRQEALSGLRFSVDQKANGQPVIRITSASAVQDPFLDMLIELNWSSGRMIREYTILLDPPAVARPAEVARPVAAAGSPEASGRQEAVPATGESTRARPTAAAGAASPDRYGPVRSGETLRGIASKVKPAEVSLEQMIVSLYQANKSAFQNNNMNRLNRGRVLNVPDAATAMAITRTEAARTISGHANEWHAYRRKLAEMAGETPDSMPGDASEGRITPQESGRAAASATPPKDVLKLSKGDPGSGKLDAKSQERMLAMEEEIAAKGRALQEAQDRVSQLERSVRDMQKLLDLKAQEAARTPVPPVAPVPEAVEPEAPVVEPAAPAPAPTPVEPPKPAPVAAPLPVAEPETSWISTFIGNPIYIGGIVAALLLSALLWMMMVGSKRRQGLTKFEDSIMTGGEFKNNAVFKASAGNIASGSTTEGSMLLTDFSRLGMGAIDSHEVDPIAEAEVYMAYGRDAQAEEILREALIKDPSRYEIALKLLELYASRKDTNSFETTASELYASLSGQNTPVWQRAAEMGRSIDPQNPLYRVAVSQADSAVAPVAAAAAAAAAAATVSAFAASKPAASVDSAALEGLSSIDDWGDSLKPQATPSGQDNAGLDFAPAPAPAPAVPQSDDNLLEFESAMQTPEPDLAAALASTEPAPVDELELAVDAPGAIELSVPDAPEELGLELPDAVDFDSVQELTAATPVEELSDFDLPGEPGGLETESGHGDMPVLDLSGIDLELETAGEAETVATLPAELDLAADFDPFQTAADATAELSAVEFEPEITAPAAAAVEDFAADLAEPPAATNVDEPDDDIDPELREEVNTKLDLARAYMEMGDREGAREILQEVLGEGDRQQRADAEKLIAEAG